MPRKGPAPKRQILPDGKFNSKVLARFINKVMLRGKKSTAEHITYGALDIIAEKTGRDPMDIFSQALSNAMPLVEVRPRRVGGATYQVPVEVPARRARTLAVRWLVQFARQRRERDMAHQLAHELLDAIQQQGNAFKRKDDIYRMAQANKAFAHYRW